MRQSLQAVILGGIFALTLMTARFAPGQSRTASPAVAIGSSDGKEITFYGAFHPQKGWQDASTPTAQQAIRAGTRVRLLQGGRNPVMAMLGKVTLYEFDGAVSLSTPVVPPAPPGQYLALANLVSNPLPRPVRLENATSAADRFRIAAFLRSRRVQDRNPRVTQHLSVDLNSDGKVEHLLVAARIPRAVEGVSKNFYSAVFLRTASGTLIPFPGAATAEVKIYEDSVSRFKILACADINRDGKMEILVEGKYYEHTEILAFAFDGKRVRSLTKK